MKIRTPKYTTSIIIIGILWAGTDRAGYRAGGGQGRAPPDF
jgi:hypothetical protein